MSSHVANVSPYVMGWIDEAIGGAALVRDDHNQLVAATVTAEDVLSAMFHLPQEVLDVLAAPFSPTVREVTFTSTSTL